jgi:hypothetical protein
VDQVFGGEHGDLGVVAEGHGASALHARVVECVIGEEEVDRGVFPVQPDLAVVANPSEGLLAARVDAEALQDVQHRGRLVDADEEVHVDVVGPSRRGVVGQRQGASEGVRDVRLA